MNVRNVENILLVFIISINSENTGIYTLNKNLFIDLNLYYLKLLLITRFIMYKIF
jgi:hypothetical protein